MLYNTRPFYTTSRQGCSTIANDKSNPSEYKGQRLHVLIK